MSRIQDGLSNYTFIKNLGSGTYGNVGLYKRNRDGKQVAIKKQTIQSVYSNLGEIDVLNRFNHPNLANILSFFFEGGDAYYVYELGSDLKSQIATLPDRIRNMYEIASALKCLHSNEYYHCDIKPSNMLLFDNPDGSKRAVLTDFGFARNRNIPPYPCSTLDYAAPEAILQSYPHLDRFVQPAVRPYFMQTKDSKKIDIWALGMSFIDFIVGRSAIYQPGTTEEQMIQNLTYYLLYPKEYLKGLIPGTPLYGHPMPDDWINFILSMTDRDATKRINVDELLSNPPFSGYAPIPCRVINLRLLNPTLDSLIDFEQLRRIVLKWNKNFNLTYYAVMVALDLFYRVYDTFNNQYQPEILYGLCLIIANFITEHDDKVNALIAELQKLDPTMTIDRIRDAVNEILKSINGQIMIPTLYDYSFNKGTLLKSFFLMLSPEYITTDLKDYAKTQLEPYRKPVNTISIEEKYRLPATTVYLKL